VGVIIAFQVLSWLALGLRLYVRRFMVKLVGWDDSTFKPKTLAPCVPQWSWIKARLNVNSPHSHRHGSRPGAGHIATLQYPTLHSVHARQLLISCLATKYGLGLHIADVPVKDLTTMLAFVWWSGVRIASTPHSTPPLHHARTRANEPNRSRLTCHI